jgi:hypothetical protein
MTHDYNLITAPPEITVTTVVPYADEPEYREYSVPSDELPTFLENLDRPEIAERVLNVDLNTEDDNAE